MPKESLPSILFYHFLSSIQTDGISLDSENPKIYNIFMKKEKWIFPEYYQHFSCKADKCRHTCCSSWRIPVSRAEYNALNNMECSEDLYRRVQMAFEDPDFITDDCFRYISFNWLGQCPLQDKGLCSVHREKGEQFLPKICRLYPRSLKRISHFNVASCSSSCEAVLELLYDSASMNIVEGYLDLQPEIHYDTEPEDVRQIKLFQDMLKDRSTTLAQCIHDICLIINEKQFREDYDSDDDPVAQALKLLKQFSHSNDRLESVTRPIIERYAANPEYYREDAGKFEKDFPRWMEFFERVINNSMIYENFPFVDRRTDRTDAYKGLCICYGLLRILCIGNHCFKADRDSLIDAVAALFHLIDHTAFYYNVAVITDNAAIMIKL